MIVGRRQVLMGIVAASTVAVWPAGSSAASDIPLIVDGLSAASLDSESLARLRKGGVTCIHQSVVNADSFGPIYQFVDQNFHHASIARCVADIYEARQQNKIAIVLGAQSAMYVERALRKTAQLSTIPKTLGFFHGMGLRIQGICFNNNNIFGGGILNPTSPLTRAGRRLVESIHHQNILLDVGGHTGEQTSLDAIAISAGLPVICSHTNMAALMPNVRSISDKLCDAIAQTGGVIGISGVGDFHTRGQNNFKDHGRRSPQATLEQHLDHYDYLKRRVGIEHVALGSDIHYGKNMTIKTDGSLLFPDEMISEGPLQMIKGFSHMGEIGNVINGLKSRGWTINELHQMLGGNWLRVYKKVWGA